MSGSSSSDSAIPAAQPARPALTPDEQKQEDEWRADPELAFEDGVVIAFSRWEALHIGVNNMGGNGQEMIDGLVTTAVDWFLEEKTAIHWDDVEGWLSEVLADEFHVDAQDGSPEQMGRLLCTLYTDVFIKKDFTGLHRMMRSQSEVTRRMMDARRIGQAESDRHARLVEQQEADDDDFSEGDEEEDDGAAGSGSAGASASAAAAAPPPEPVEEKTAEQLQDEADGWEVAGKKGKKGGKK